MAEIMANGDAQSSALVRSEATQQDGALGAGAVGRVLVVALDVPLSGAMMRLREALEAAQHTVATASFEEWRAALPGTRPDIVVLEAADELTSTQACRALRAADARLAILAVSTDEKDSLRQSSAQSSAEAALWASLQSAGADDFITASAPVGTLILRLEVLLRLVQLGRELDASRARLARHMQIDETTQLLNRRFFFQNSHRECSRARRYGHALSCLMIEINYLDELSKKFGYACGEYVLRAVAYTVRQWTRDSDIAGRFSDTKFVVLLPETDVDGATSVREKILDAIDAGRFEWEGEQIPVSVSIGESERQRELSSPDAHSPSETLPDEFGSAPLSVREELAALLEDADAALNVARRACLRPTIFTPYTPGIETQQKERA